MFLAFLTQAPKAVQKAELRTIMMPRIKIHGELTHALSSPLMPRTDTPPDQEIQTSALLHAGDSGADIFCSRHFEDMQLSYLLVNSCLLLLGRVSLAHFSGIKVSGDISGCDISAPNNFDRLKAQSKRTIQTLVENRRRLAQRACKFRICGTVLYLIFAVKSFCAYSERTPEAL